MKIPTKQRDLIRATRNPALAKEPVLADRPELTSIEIEDDAR